MKKFPYFLCLICCLFACKKSEEGDVKNAFESGTNNDPIYYEKQFFSL